MPVDIKIKPMHSHVEEYKTLFGFSVEALVWVA